MSSSRIVTITGPTCAGKSTLQNHLLATGKFQRIIGCAGRKPREGEQDGVDYHFKSNEYLVKQIEADKMVEWVYYRSNYYGVTKKELDEVLKGDKIPLVVLEPQGLKHFTEAGYSNLFSIYVGGKRPELIRRFFHRLNPDMDYNASRMEGMIKEIEEWKDAWKYSFKVPTFEANNIETVVAKIVAAVEK